MNISPTRNREGIQIGFTVEGVRYRFHPLPGGKWDSKRDRQLVTSVATKITNDILAGNFDPTLDRYRHKSMTECSVDRQVAVSISKKCWLELWDGWVTSLELPHATAASHYACLRAMLVNADSPTLSRIDWLTESRLAASTFNRRLSMLRSCLQWASDERLIKAEENPLKKLKSRITTEQERQFSDDKKTPLSETEIKKILEYVDNRHSTYAPFVRFLLFSGVRTGEAVGLIWENIDLDKRLIYIKQSISRERGKYQKIRKSPKTRASIRTLRMSERIYELLMSILPSREPLGLVFRSPKGQVIDHGNFRCHCWKPTLSALNIPYRKPYVTRHTLLSQALESGLSVPQVAQIAGHRDGRMIVTHYGHVINQPQLP